MREAWDRQVAFTDKLFPDKSKLNLTEITKEYVLSIHSEADELLRELPDWKYHRQPGQATIVSNVYEELSDLWKYVCGLAYLRGLTYEAFEEEILRKSLVVETRWHQEKELPSLLEHQRVALIDIDGVLTPWPESLERFAVEHCPDLDIHDLEQREVIKDAYRQSGVKQHLSVIESSAEALRQLRERGFVIVLLTHRKYRQYKRVFSDTVIWLQKNEIPFDHILWASEEKFKSLLLWKQNIVFAVDDLLDTCLELSRFGIKTYWYGAHDRPAGTSLIPITDLLWLEELQ